MIKRKNTQKHEEGEKEKTNYEMTKMVTKQKKKGVKKER